jgi:hypothetical protein
VTPTCVVCERPTADGYACSSCTAKAARHLAEIIDMTPAARDVAHRTSRRSDGAGSTGKPGSSLPLDLGATARLDAVQAQLTTQCAHIAHHRGTLPPWLAYHGDPITAAATWLTPHLEWARHRPDVDQLLTVIDEAARIIRGIARGPAEQKYLGPCGAPTAGFDNWATYEPCQGDVYGPRGGSVGRCRTCEAEVAQADREAWLDGEVRSRAFRATQISEAYGVNIKTIRTWIARGLLVGHGFDGYDNQGRERPTYNVGEVLDLAAADAVRRAEQQAKRARRREQADTEGDAA